MKNVRIRGRNLLSVLVFNCQRNRKLALQLYIECSCFFELCFFANTLTDNILKMDRVAIALTMCMIGAAGGAAPVDWIERSPSGAYEFGYATGDSGGHYRQEAASADNTIAGKYGFRDPATGANLETTYTSGRRGFRARGPHIARRMGLSQAGGSNRPKDDGQYHPELDHVFDPTEDRGYDFQFRSKDQVKEEHADARGDVQGRYWYVDDVGGRHSVEYTAGANTGFNVNNPVPDTFAQAQGSPLVFNGRGPGSRARGYTAIQKALDGSYRFAASGPDHKRTEVSDSVGNRRGSYTYLDDKGQQRTVEYIAGPNIGYQVINNRRPLVFGPNGAPIPTLSPSLSPFYHDFSSSTPFPSSPFFTDPPPSTTPFFPSSSTGKPTSSGGWTPSTGNHPTTTWSATTPSSPSSTWFDDPKPTYGSINSILHQEGLNTAASGPIRPNNGSSQGAYSTSCCGQNWHTGPKRGTSYRGSRRYEGSFHNDDAVGGRALRAHVQSIDVTDDQRHMSPGEALELFGSGTVEHRSRVLQPNLKESLSRSESRVSSKIALPEHKSDSVVNGEKNIGAEENDLSHLEDNRFSSDTESDKANHVTPGSGSESFDFAENNKKYTESKHSDDFLANKNDDYFQNWSAFRKSESRNTEDNESGFSESRTNSKKVPPEHWSGFGHSEAFEKNANEPGSDFSESRVNNVNVIPETQSTFKSSEFFERLDKIWRNFSESTDNSNKDSKAQDSDSAAAASKKPTK